MKISISVANIQSSLPQIMFAGNLDRHFALLAGMGYDGVDLFFPKPGETDAKEVRKLLDRNGLKVTMLASQGDLMGDGLFLNDRKRLPELLDRSSYHLEQCAILEAMPNVGFIRGQHKNVPGDSLSAMADGLAAYCAKAASYGLNVLLEPICRYEIDSLATTAQALDLWKQAGSPENLRLLLDVFHMNIEERSICAAIAQAGPRIGHVHFVDNTRAVPGYGCMGLKDIVACLASVGYDAFLGIEAMPGPAPEEEARHGLAYTRALLAAR